MRFFSNDARESEDDQTHDDRPERVQSDPVAVPNQRPPSPWSNTPAATDDKVDGDADDDRRDDTPAAATATATVDADPDRPAFAEPSAFGGSTVGTPAAGNTYASSTATRDDVDLSLDDSSSPDSATDSAAADPEPVVTDSDELKDSPSDLDTAADASADEDTSAVDDRVSAVDAPDHEASPDDSDDSSDSSDDEPAAVADTATAAEIDEAKDEHDDDTVQAVAPADEEPADEEPAEEPAVVPVPVGAGVSAPAAQAETLFGADNARSFQDRWRDVQLRFVDSPKDAAADAAKLIDEAVEKLTAGLKAQRDGLASDTEDTEELRVQLRGYRDILNRIVAL